MCAVHQLSLQSLKDADYEAWKLASTLLAPKIRVAIYKTLSSASDAVVQDLQSEVFSWLVCKVKASAFDTLPHLEARAIIKARSLAIDYIRRQSRSPIVECKNPGDAERQMTSTSPNQQTSPADELVERELA